MDLTLVTMFYDIGRDRWNNFPRRAQDYINTFEVFLRYDYNMIIFIDDRYYIALKEMLERSNSPNKTLIPINEDWLANNIDAWSRLDKERAIMNSQSYKDLIPHRIAQHYPENVNPEYTILTHSKIDVVNWAIDNMSESIGEYVAWVDFGYFHNKTSAEFLPRGDFNLDKFNKDRVNICLVNPIDDQDQDIYYTLKNAPEKIGAYFFMGNKQRMAEFKQACARWLNIFQEELGICDDEQGLWLQVHFENPDLFELHTFGRWHQAMRYFTGE